MGWWMVALVAYWMKHQLAAMSLHHVCGSGRGHHTYQPLQSTTGMMCGQGVALVRRIDYFALKVKRRFGGPGPPADM